MNHTSPSLVHPKSIDRSFVPARSPFVYAVEVDDEVVLLDEVRERLHLLNSTGALVWSVIDGQTSVGDLAREFSVEFGVEEAVALADTLAVVKHLGTEGLLRAVVCAHDDVDEAGS